MWTCFIKLSSHILQYSKIYKFPFNFLKFADQHCWYHSTDRRHRGQQTDRCKRGRFQRCYVWLPWNSDTAVVRSQTAAGKYIYIISPLSILLTCVILPQVRERKRIHDAGGFIAFRGVWRVAGILATSRALGDYPLKDKNLVIANPDILTFDLNDHKWVSAEILTRNYYIIFILYFTGPHFWYSPRMACGTPSTMRRPALLSKNIYTKRTLVPKR